MNHIITRGSWLVPTGGTLVTLLLSPMYYALCQLRATPTSDYYSQSRQDQPPGLSIDQSHRIANMWQCEHDTTLWHTHARTHARTHTHTYGVSGPGRIFPTTS
jgi:hypothetical protein